MCPSGWVPMIGPTSSTLNTATGKFRRQTCIDQNGNTLTIGNNTHSGAEAFKNINNIQFCSQFAGADNGIRCLAAINALPATGGVVYDDECGAQTWSTNWLGAITTAKVTIQFTCAATFSISVQQTPNVNNIRLFGIGGYGGNGGGTGATGTVLSVGFAAGDVFVPTATGNTGEIANVSFLSGVTRTSGFWFDPAPGANHWRIHDNHFQNYYGVFKGFASGGTGLNDWFFNNNTFNCNSGALHHAQIFWIGASDTTSGSTASEMKFKDNTSTGDICINDTAQVIFDTGVDAPIYSGNNLGPSRNGTSTQPIIKFQNTAAGATIQNAARDGTVTDNFIEGTGVAGNDCLNMAAFQSWTFSGNDISGCDHGVLVSGGVSLKIRGGWIANNLNGGLVVNPSVTGLALSSIDVDYFGNSVGGNNLADDVTIAGATTELAFIANHFGSVSSTVTANLPRYGINLLAGATSKVRILGNTMPSANFVTGCINDASNPGNQEIIEDPCVASGNKVALNISGSTGGLIRLKTASGRPNWQISCQENTNIGCDFTPSTTNNGSTFTNPAVSWQQNGNGGTFCVGGSTSGLGCINAPATGGITNTFPTITGSLVPTANTGAALIQTKRGVAGCTTAASIGGICATDITVTWGTAFADTNYSVSCTGSTPTAVPAAPFVVSGTKLAATVHINYFAITAVAASYATIDCTAQHD